jgi:hypothetical protein
MPAIGIDPGRHSLFAASAMLDNRSQPLDKSIGDPLVFDGNI